MNSALLEEIGGRFQNAQRILVVSHIRPDGDAVGSLLGLGLALQATGKQVQMVLSDGVPVNFRYLPGSQQVVNRSEAGFDLVVVLDCSDLKRVGNTLSADTVPDVNIDHHVTNLNFAKLNLVDISAVATAEILAESLSMWGLPLEQPVAEALLTGIITDTLGFRTSNMTPKALRVAADLIEVGADLSRLYTQALTQRSFEAVRFWGVGLQRIQRDDGLVWTTLSTDDRKSAGYGGRDDADLINVLSSIQDARIALIFVEQPNGSVKVSWRGQPGVDVSEIALRFGGGGHPAAAGAEIPGGMEEVRSTVLQATRSLLP
jgi:bifunctional oligoribonuclease and PAP phosphatase NrnA